MADIQDAGYQVKKGDYILVTTNNGRVVDIKPYDATLASEILASKGRRGARVFKLDGVGYQGGNPMLADVTKDIIAAELSMNANQDILPQTAGKEGVGGEYKDRTGSPDISQVGISRVFDASGKYVGETANEIEKKFPGRVVGVEINVFRSDGSLLTDLDIELSNVVIQVKSGSGKKLTRQLVNTQTGTTKFVIGYTPDLKPSSAVVRGAKAMGFEVFTTWEDLLEYLYNH